MKKLIIILGIFAMTTSLFSMNIFFESLFGGHTKLHWDYNNDINPKPHFTITIKIEKIVKPFSLIKSPSLVDYPTIIAKVIKGTKNIKGSIMLSLPKFRIKNLKVGDVALIGLITDKECVSIEKILPKKKKE